MLLLLLCCIDAGLALILMDSITLLMGNLCMSIPPRWLWGNSSALYDTIAMAAEDQAELVQQACPHCLLVYNHGLDPVAGRYAALYKLIQTEVWQSKVASKYQYIYFPEDEIVQSVDSVNRCALNEATRA